MSSEPPLTAGTPAELPDLSADSGDPAPWGGTPVAAGRGLAWWQEGWRLFAAAPWLWIGMTFTMVVLLFVLALIPLLGHIASTLLYPILGAGLLVGAREIDRGGTLRFEHLFACFDARVGPLIIAALLYLVGWFLVWLIAIGICAIMFGLSSLSALMNVDPSIASIETLVTLGIAVIVALLLVLVLGTPLMMAYWFAPALIALRGDPPIAALKASFRASLRNVPPMLVYGLLFIVFAIVASIPMGLGWIVLAPVFAISVYVSYRDIFGR